MKEYGPDTYRSGAGEIRRPAFPPDSVSAQRAAELTQRGLSEVEKLNGNDLHRLTSRWGAYEVDEALTVAQQIFEQTGRMPEVPATYVLGVARLAQSSRDQPRNWILAENVKVTRRRLYTHMAQSVEDGPDQVVADSE